MYPLPSLLQKNNKTKQKQQQQSLSLYCAFEQRNASRCIVRLFFILQLKAGIAPSFNNIPI